MDKYQNEIKYLKALSHPARLEILEAPCQGEACVWSKRGFLALVVGADFQLLDIS